MSMELFAELDPASQAAAARLANPDLLNPALVNMLCQTVEDMQEIATEFMYASFINPGNGVEQAWEPVVQSTTLATLTNTADYARRLNFGFSDMTDISGRYYPYWPDYHWVEYTVAKVTPQVEEYFKTGFESAVGGGS